MFLKLSPFNNPEYEPVWIKQNGLCVSVFVCKRERERERERKEYCFAQVACLIILGRMSMYTIILTIAKGEGMKKYLLKKNIHMACFQATVSFYQ